VTDLRAPFCCNTLRKADGSDLAWLRAYNHSYIRKQDNQSQETDLMVSPRTFRKDVVSNVLNNLRAFSCRRKYEQSRNGSSPHNTTLTAAGLANNHRDWVQLDRADDSVALGVHWKPGRKPE